MSPYNILNELTKFNVITLPAFSNYKNPRYPYHHRLPQNVVDKTIKNEIIVTSILSGNAEEFIR